MLFHSVEFLFIFLPIAVIGYHLIKGETKSRIWLISVSLFFYGWWNPKYLILIMVSMLVNFKFGSGLISTKIDTQTKKQLLIFGVVFNLLLLGYFKYLNFFIETFNNITNQSFPLHNIILPLAISFFTFQQIAYLVDASKNKITKHDFLNYALFVTFFPQLIAGPIVHHKEMMPQFDKPKNKDSVSLNFSIGFSLFFIGLFKKLIFADSVGEFATPIYLAADKGESIFFLEAWIAAICYTLQLYFDFSGYCDMACGIAKLFGITLPMNFNSPYKAQSIIEFWRRWHITLSRFLRDYVYIPLGGNRLGESRKITNLMLTMLIGGLWHGAGWNFVLWGAWHGGLLVINHIWATKRKSQPTTSKSYKYCLSVLITFLCVMVGWVFFRATTFNGAIQIIYGMAGCNGLNDLATIIPSEIADALKYSFILCIVIWACPNSHEIFCFSKPVLDSPKASVRKWYHWRVSKLHALFFALIASYLVLELLKLNQVQQFLYFDF